MGISKKELLKDYYIDEITEIFYEYNELYSNSKENLKEVAGDSFFNF